MSDATSSFQTHVWDYYRTHGRSFPWRETEPSGSFDPYKILVSEMMLQQTQVSRVIPKYESFLAKFPHVRLLAGAPLSEVIVAWSGLGYNRRAKFLWQAAGIIDELYGGAIPPAIEQLETLPGIGRNTAAAIAAYAFNQPVIFIETNIRTVFIHHFFADQDNVTDKEISSVVAMMLDRENPREWYWALMDYGTYLKRTHGNISRRSSRYTKQSTFKGSRREIRGHVLKLLGQCPQNVRTLKAEVSDPRLDEVLSALIHEGLIKKTNKLYHL